MWAVLGGGCHDLWDKEEGRYLLPSAIAQGQEPRGALGSASWHPSVTKAREGSVTGVMTCPWGVWAMNAKLQDGAFQRESRAKYPAVEDVYLALELWQLW